MFNIGLHLSPPGRPILTRTIMIAKMVEVVAMMMVRYSRSPDLWIPTWAVGRVLCRAAQWGWCRLILYNTRQYLVILGCSVLVLWARCKLCNTLQYSATMPCSIVVVAQANTRQSGHISRSLQQPTFSPPADAAHHNTKICILEIQGGSLPQLLALKFQAALSGLFTFDFVSLPLNQWCPEQQSHPSPL